MAPWLSAWTLEIVERADVTTVTSSMTAMKTSCQGWNALVWGAG